MVARDSMVARMLIQTVTAVISGAIFDWGDRAAKSGFLFGIHRFNTNPDEAFQLAVYIDVIDVSDSFKLASSSKLYVFDRLYKLV